MYTAAGRRSAPLWVLAGLVIGLAAALAITGVQSAGATGHTTGNERIALSANEVDFEPGLSRSKVSVWIRGSGFQPGREITLLASDSAGALYEISGCRQTDDGVCDPGARRDGGGAPWPLITNEDGAFASNWLLGRFTRQNVGTEALVTIWAVETASYEFLASAPLALCNLNNREEGAEVPDFCSA